MEKPQNPKWEEDETLDQFYDMSSVASATSYTGLTPTPPHSEDEAMSYSMLYAYPHQDNKSSEDNKKHKKTDKKQN